MEKTKEKKKIVLGVSGGVDSSTAALLLQKKGYQVIGVHFDIWPQIKEEGKMLGNILPDAATKAFEMCRSVGIEFIYKNVSEDFENIIIENFCSEYKCGRTPNPCIICNPIIKYQVLIDVANQVGAEYIATGHYAKIEKSDGYTYIKKADNAKKDQSYVLYRLPEEIIKRTLFPLGEVEDKELVKKLAIEHKLIDDEYRDSQGICFLKKGETYNTFLEKKEVNIGRGFFYDTEGKKLGEHTGVINYTIGQKKGLGLSLGKEAFVKAIDGKNNIVIITYDERDLFTKEVEFSDGVFINEKVFEKIEGDEFPYTAKPRYAAPAAKCKLEKNKVVFEESQRAPTPGQSIVIYKGDLVMGGGFIL